MKRAPIVARVPSMVTTLASFLQQWLLPRLNTFNEKYPDIDLRVHTSPQLVDFLRSEVQAAVRFGVGDWPGLHVEKVLDEWLVPVCSKSLLDKHGAIGTRDDLRRLPLLHSLSEPWNEWPDIKAASENWGTGGSSFDDSVTVVRAAAASRGLCARALEPCVSGHPGRPARAREPAHHFGAAQLLLRAARRVTSRSRRWQRSASGSSASACRRRSPTSMRS